MAQKLSYYSSVNYSIADPAKVLAQTEGAATAGNMPFGFKEVAGTRGESAYVFDMGNGTYGALVQEGLGTKSLIAQAIYKKTGKLYFAEIAQDTVACIINDLVSVGATPVVLNAYWSASSYDWLGDKKLTEGFIKGWRAACDKARVVWGGGETQSLPGIVSEGSLEFAGSGFGMIKSPSRLVQGKNLHAGDAIVLLEATGPHANGISMVRQIAEQLPEGYDTRLVDGTTFGEAALKPTPLYAEVVGALFDAGLNIHYLSNITGHGWRKIMRADVEFSYILHKTTPVQEVFNFIAEHSGNNEQEMYGNYNMGAGYAVYLPAAEAKKAVEVAAKCGLKAWVGGEVKTGPKKVVIEPKNITFASDALEVR